MSNQPAARTVRKTTLSRRDLLRYGAAGATTLALMGPLGKHVLPSAYGAIAQQNHLTIINMFGGNDGLNTVVPMIPGVIDVYSSRRSTIAIDPVADGAPMLADKVTGDVKYALHPTMTNIGRLYNDGDVGVINLVGYPNENLSHFTSEDIWSRGVRGSFGSLGIKPSGWLSRYMDQYEPRPTAAISVGLNRRRDFTGGQTSPLVISSAAGFQFDQDSRYRDNTQYRLDVVKQILDGGQQAGTNGTAEASMAQAHALIQSTQDAINDYDANFGAAATYTNDRPSRYMRDIARMLYGGFDTRVFYTGYGGFDTHGDQGAGAPDARHGRLMKRLDDAIGSFEADMKSMGVWDNTLVMVISEFGRRCFENGSNGTDHGHGGCVLLIGGAVTGGLFGPDLTAEHLNENWLPGLVDFRDIYREILTGHLGAADLSTIFPEPQDNAFQALGLFA